MSWFTYRGGHTRVSSRIDRSPDDLARARSEALLAWERRGRGYELFPEPVRLEPAFVPYRSDRSAASGGWQAVPQPRGERVDLAFLGLLLPPRQEVTPAQMERCLAALRHLNGPLALEVIACHEAIAYQIACPRHEAGEVASALALAFPEACIEGEGKDAGAGLDRLRAALAPLAERSVGYQTVDFGLGEAFYQPLPVPQRFADDPLAAFIAGIGTLEAGEVAALQLLAAPARAPWDESLLLLIAQLQERDDLWERHAALKLSSPLWAVALRVLAVSAQGTPRALDLCRRSGRALPGAGELYHGDPYHSPLQPPRHLQRESPRNVLIALESEGYPPENHLRDALERRSRRTGMLLSAGELLGLWHPPAASLLHPRLRRHDPALRPFDPELAALPGTPLGWMRSRYGNASLSGTSLSGTSLYSAAFSSGGGETVRGGEIVRWPDAYRNRHAYLLGATRMGKSTLLHNLIAQDIAGGGGLCLIDPHGDLARDVLDTVPPQRRHEVFYLDLSDEEWPVSLGLLEAPDDWSRQLLASDLLSILRRLFAASWGDRLEHILRHVLLTLLADRNASHSSNHSSSHTLRDIRPLLSDERYREQVLRGVSDPDLRAFWRSEFPGYPASTFGPIYNKLGLLLSSPLVRNIVAQSEGRLDLAAFKRQRRVLLVNLATHHIGADNARFLGALLVSQIQIAAMSALREPAHSGNRTPFTLYVDEFQNFVVSSFETILSEAGKAGLSLVMANQYLGQLSEGLQNAILSNVGALVSFRVNAETGQRLATQFGGFYGAKELTDQERGQAVARLGRASHSYAIATPPPPDHLRHGDPHLLDAIANQTRQALCTPRAQVAAQMRADDARRREREVDSGAAGEGAPGEGTPRSRGRKPGGKRESPLAESPSTGTEVTPAAPPPGQITPQDCVSRDDELHNSFAHDSFAHGGGEGEAPNEGEPPADQIPIREEEKTRRERVTLEQIPLEQVPLDEPTQIGWFEDGMDHGFGGSFGNDDFGNDSFGGFDSGFGDGRWQGEAPEPKALEGGSTGAKKATRTRNLAPESPLDNDRSTEPEPTSEAPQEEAN